MLSEITESHRDMHCTDYLRRAESRPRMEQRFQEPGREDEQSLTNECKSAVKQDALQKHACCLQCLQTATLEGTCENLFKTYIFSSAVKSTHCSCRRLESGSQNPHQAACNPSTREICQPLLPECKFTHIHINKNKINHNVRTHTSLQVSCYKKNISKICLLYASEDQPCSQLPGDMYALIQVVSRIYSDYMSVREKLFRQCRLHLADHLDCS